MDAEAVPAFFVVSGFYMALILETKYRGAPWAFYAARFLRLFPIYWAFLFIIAVVSLLPSFDVGLFIRLSHAARLAVGNATESVVAAVPNVFMFGADWLRNMNFNPVDGSVHWWLWGAPEGPTLHGFYHLLAVPQVWSLAVELTFYALAPTLVLLRTRALAALCLAAALMLPPLTWHLAYNHMLPTVNFWYFLLGMIGYRFLPKLETAPRALNVALAIVPFVIALAWPAFGTSGRTGIYISALIATFAIGVPSLFLLTKDWRRDRWLGEFSYPIYITHFLFAWPAGVFGEQYAWLVCLAISAALSFLLMRYLQDPIDRYRARLAVSAGTHKVMRAGAC